MKQVNKNTNFVIQAIILAVASLITRFLGFLYRVPLTNLIGNVGNGIYGNGYYIYMFFLIVSSAGLPVAISKMVSVRLANKQYRDAHQVFKVSLFSAAVLGLISSYIMLLSSDFFSQLIKSPQSRLSLITLSPTILIVAIMSTFRGYFQGMKNSVPTAISQLIEQIFNATFSIFLAYKFLSFGIEYAAAGATAATGIGALLGLITIIVIYMMARKKILRRVEEDYNKRYYEKNMDILKELFSIAIPVIIGTAIFSMTNIIDMFMVKSILIAQGNTQEFAESAYGLLSGKYNVLTTLPVSISTSFAIAAIPSISQSVKFDNEKTVNQKINTAIRITMLFSIPSAVGIGVLGNQILTFLFKNYPEGASLLHVGAISIIFLSIVQITTGMLQAIGKVKIPAYAALCGAILKIPLNYYIISIKELNILGAVISTSICYLVAAIIDIYFLIKVANIKINIVNTFIKPIISSIFMGIICYFGYEYTLKLTNNSIALFVAIIFGIFVYFICIILTKTLDKQDFLSLPFGNKITTLLEKKRLL